MAGCASSATPLRNLLISPQTGAKQRDARSEETIRAREVLLCAGAIDSPTILHRSAIGPADWLAKAGIPLRHELPVGEHFQDHPLVSLVLQLREAHAPAPGPIRTAACATAPARRAC